MVLYCKKSEENPPDGGVTAETKAIIISIFSLTADGVFDACSPFGTMGRSVEPLGQLYLFGWGWNVYDILITAFKLRIVFQFISVLCT